MVLGLLSKHVERVDGYPYANIIALNIVHILLNSKIILINKFCKQTQFSSFAGNVLQTLYLLIQKIKSAALHSKSLKVLHI